MPESMWLIVLGVIVMFFGVLDFNNITRWFIVLGMILLCVALYQSFRKETEQHRNKKRRVS